MHVEGGQWDQSTLKASMWRISLAVLALFSCWGLHLINWQYVNYWESKEFSSWSCHKCYWTGVQVQLCHHCPFTLFFLCNKWHLFVLTGYYRHEMFVLQAFIWPFTTVPKMQIVFSPLLWRWKDSMMMRGQWLFKALYNNVINAINGSWLLKKLILVSLCH